MKRNLNAKKATSWAFFCLTAFILMACGGSADHSTSTVSTAPPIDFLAPTPHDTTSIQRQPVTPAISHEATVDDYEDGLMEADALAEEDRGTGHPGHHADDYGDSDGDNEDYDEGWEDGYDF